MSLASVAREAGVGVGTAYRHFPTQDALVEAAYRDEVTRLCDAADELLATLPPDEGLARWLHLCVDHVTTKRGMSEALRALAAAGTDLSLDSRGRVIAALAMLLDAAQAAGTVRGDIDAEDLATALGGIYQIPGDPQKAHRIMNVVIDGLRPAPR